MNSTAKRSFVALATVAAWLALVANPASANPTHSATITGGTVNIASPAQSIPLGGGSGNCPAGTITIAHDETATPHTLDITALSTTGEFELPTGSGNFWVAQIDRVASVPGTHVGTTISGVEVDVQAVIRGPITQGSCDTTAPVRCTIQTNQNLVFGGSFGDTNGNGEPDAGEVATVSASNVPITTAPPCLPPFSTYFNGTANVSGLTALLTS